ncbi:MFS transporter [Cryptosporangium aurantiacum]|uniref:Drug resistance transporter, EmrB/QacA subfamily n=1 Tax=Cryptosporangium aurantiacum TaxID=134849 RepID=A0A1M7RN64_9ACTN|nr:MFS transporter [Cryptosporangium aurantiacum]SHN47512.1 drug resistance transporter, EmrB/QacA subfamily [Cryptosporangium aurantiacum]
MQSTGRWWALAALNLGVLVVGLDGTVLSVALPTLAGALDASQSDLVWFSSGYLLVLAAAVLPVGVLGDRFGRKKVLLTSLVGFGVGSAICAYAPSVGVFLGGRALQGLSGAGITVMALSALVVLFPAAERPRAVAVYQAANFLSLLLGPLLGGWMLDRFWWGWVFLLNVPVVLVALGVGVLLIPESRAAERPGLDPLGTVTSALGLVLTIGGVIRAGQHGWDDAGTLALLGGGLVALVGFAGWERRGAARPLIDRALFGSATFLRGSALVAVAGLAMIGTLFTLPQFFQDVRGAEPIHSGLSLLPLIAGTVLGAGLSAPLGRTAGVRPTVAAGFLVLAAGLLLGTTTDVDSGSWWIGAWTCVLGVGTGMVLTAATSAALSGLDAEHSGVGSAVVQAFNKTSGPFGAAISGSIVVAVYQDRLETSGVTEAARRGLADGLDVASRTGSDAVHDAVLGAFVAGFRTSLLVSAAIAVAGAIAAAVLLPRRDTTDHPARREHMDAAHG